MLVAHKWQRGFISETLFNSVHGNCTEHRGKAEKTLKIEYLL